jgi:hypothetical protein
MRGIQMTRPKLALVGLCIALLGVMSMFASSAQAAGSWLVGTTEITKTSTLLAEATSETESTAIILFTVFHIMVGIGCTQSTISHIHLAAEGKFSEGGKVIFTGCTVSGAGVTCTVKSPGAAVGTVASEELKGELVLHTGGVVLAKIEPKSAGGNLGTVRFEGAECLLPESNKVTGVVYLKDCENKAETLAVKHLIEQGPLTSVSFGADTAEHLETSFSGSAWVKLTGLHNNVEWRGMGV